MNICITSTSNNLDAQIDSRFGRCTYFLIIDPDTLQFKAIPNSSQDATGGAGIQAAQQIASHGAKVLLTGNVGPNAFQALQAAGIEIITGVSGTVQEAVERYKRGEYTNRANAPTVPEHSAKGRQQ
jgi:predicted Fe-Mo cluster-binding NifX family protein